MGPQSSRSRGDSLLSRFPSEFQELLEFNLRTWREIFFCSLLHYHPINNSKSIPTLQLKFWFVQLLFWYQFQFQFRALVSCVPWWASRHCFIFSSPSRRIDPTQRKAEDGFKGALECLGGFTHTFGRFLQNPTTPTLLPASAGYVEAQWSVLTSVAAGYTLSLHLAKPPWQTQLCCPSSAGELFK